MEIIFVGVFAVVGAVKIEGHGGLEIAFDLDCPSYLAGQVALYIATPSTFGHADDADL